MPGTACRLFVAASLLLLCAAGCGHEQTITTHTVPVVRQRMLGAIVKHDSKIWYFKVTGPLEPMQSVAETFQTFVKSVHFPTSGGPEVDWKLPPKWTAKPGDAMRFATLEIEQTTPALELSVTSLPLPPALPINTVILLNVNRWRKQLDLYDIKEFELSTETTEIAMAGGGKATLVDLVGSPEPTRPKSAIPKTGGGAPPMMGTGLPGMLEESEEAEELPFTFAAPPEWTKVPNVTYSVATYGVQAEGKKVVISITPSGGDLLANVNRWRGQVGLAPITAMQAVKDAQARPVDKRMGRYFRLVGEQETLLGVIFDIGDRTWFFKLKGDNDLAERERARFEAFIGSLKFQ